MSRFVSTAGAGRRRGRRPGLRVGPVLLAVLVLATATPVGADDGADPTVSPTGTTVPIAEPTVEAMLEEAERTRGRSDGPAPTTASPTALEVSAQAAPHVEISVTPSGFADADGDGRYEQGYLTNDGGTDCPGSWSLEMSVSGAPLLAGRIEMRMTSARWHPVFNSLAGGFPIAGTTVLTGSHDIYAPYDEHVVAINLASPLNSDNSGVNFSRTFRTCPTTFINPYDATGTISFRVTGSDVDGNPVEVPAGTYDFEFRPVRNLAAWSTARPIVPAEDPGPGSDPGYNLTYDFQVAAGCFGGMVCAPYVGTVTQSFASLPPGAKFVSVGWVNPPPDGTWDPAPPSGDLATLHLPGESPLDLGALAGLGVGDSLPASVALPLRTWARRVCPENSGVPGHMTPAPANQGSWPTPGNIFCAEPRDYDRLRWAVTVWVPEPPSTTSYPVTLTNAGDFDWNGTNERTWFDLPEGGTASSVARSYTLNPAPPISLHSKEGCAVTGLSHANRSRAHGSHMTTCELLPDPMPGADETYRITFRPADAIVVNPVVVDVLPPGGLLESFTVPSPPAGGAPGDNTWSAEFHAGPCHRDTTTGWVPQSAWSDPLAAVRCIRWSAPFTSLGGQNHNFVVNLRRDLALNPFVLPASGHPYQSPHGSLVAEWNASGAECYRNATPPPSGSGWVAAGSIPAGDVRCVRWRRPGPASSLDTVVIFTVDTTADPDGDSFDPGEGIWWNNTTAMWSDNAPNATAANPLQANAWSGSVNQTIATTWISFPAGNFSGHLPAPGGSMTVTADARVYGGLNYGGGMRNWAIRLRIPDYLVWDPSFGAGDGTADGVQVNLAPTQFTDRSGSVLPYTCTFIPDSTPLVPGGGDVECQADGDTVDVVGLDTTTHPRRGWDVTIRLYRAPGMPAGTRSITSYTYQSLPEAPFGAQTVHPTYGPIAPDGIPYARRNVEHVTASWASDTTVGAPVFTPTFQVTKNLEDAADDPAAPGQLVEYRVGVAHASILNPDLTNTFVYDFPGFSPVDGSPVGDVRPRFVSAGVVTSGEPITFEYTCDTNGDATPTAAEAASYVWVGAPTTAPCSTPGDVIGIRARLDHGGTGRFPVYVSPTWNIGDPVNASTLRSTSFRVTVSVPEDAPHGARFVNRAHLRAAEIALTTYSNERAAVVGPLSASVLVRKVTDPAGYDEDFTVRLRGPAGYVQTATVNASNASTVTFTDMEVDGEYTLDELDLPGGWSLDAITCEDALGNPVDADALSLTRGAAITCEVRNVAEPARVTVRKVTDPGRYDQDFTVRLTGPGDTTRTGTVNAGTGTTATFDDLVPGAEYALEETGMPAGWTRSALDCVDATTDLPVAVVPLRPSPGQRIECTLGNTAATGTIVVRKVTDPERYDQDFTVRLRGSGDTTQTGTINAATEREVTFDDLPVGSLLTLDEVDLPAGWRLDSIMCADDDGAQAGKGIDPRAIRIDPGSAITCEVRNVAEPGRLTVRKVTDPERYDQDFTVRLTGPGETTRTGTVNAGTGTTATFDDLVPGAEYALDEVDLPRGWSLASAVCEDGAGASVDAAAFTPAPGDRITCIIVNVDDPASIVVSKTTEYGEYDADFTAVVYGDDDSVAKGTVNDARAEVLVVAAVPGVSYRVTEAEPGPGWRMETITCADQHGRSRDPANLAVEPGDHITCEIVNTPVPDLELTKTADGTAGPVGHVFTYTLSWRNRGDGPAFDAVITDTLPDGLEYVDSPDCEGLGQVVTCRLASVIEPGASGAVTLRARAAVAGPIVNHATITSAGGDPDLTNNESSSGVVTTETAVVPPVALAFTGRGLQAGIVGTAFVVAGLIAVRAGRRRAGVR